jgi:NAD-dependent deacetylase
MSGDQSPSDAHEAVHKAVSLIRSAKHLTAFTGAGISVESGIPPFRGPGGLWGKYEPETLQIAYFLKDPARAWPTIKEIFYDNFGRARPNRAHEVLARLEVEGWPQDGADGGRARLRMLVTQNIDNLHYAAGSRNIAEFHGNSRLLVCLSCGKKAEASPALLDRLPPRCPCGGVYKPDFIFFGEGIPAEAHRRSMAAALKTDVMLVVGSTGEVYPAAMVPRTAHENGARIIEINPEPSAFTDSITHVHVAMKAGEAFALIERELFGGT